MVLDTSLYKFLSWLFMGLHKLQKIVLIAFIGRKQTMYGLIA